MTNGKIVNLNESDLILKIEQLLNATQKRWFSIADCGHVRGFTRVYFYNYRYLLPNFGVFDDFHSHTWSKETFDEWEKIPLHELKIKWIELSETSKREYRKAWEVKKPGMLKEAV